MPVPARIGTPISCCGNGMADAGLGVVRRRLARGQSPAPAHSPRVGCAAASAAAAACGWRGLRRLGRCRCQAGGGQGNRPCNQFHSHPGDLGWGLEHRDAGPLELGGLIGAAFRSLKRLPSSTGVEGRCRAAYYALERQ